MKKTAKAGKNSTAAAIKEAVLSSSQSFSGQQDRVQQALSNVLNGRDASVDPCDGTCCTGCGYECGGNCCSACVGKNSIYIWVRDCYTDKVVYSMKGELYQRDYSMDAAGNVTFGDPVEVEVAYKTIGESHRSACGYVASLQESGAQYNAKTGELTLTVIKPGLNTSKSRYYPAAVLKRDMGIFENAKMFADHQTDKESKERPEGSVTNWVAQLGKPWAESDGTIKAKAKVIDPPFKEKLETLQKAGLLNEMGVSIRAIGVGAEAEVPDGATNVKANVVERLVAARSVDFVTFPGAGGRCEVLESDRSDEFDLELATVQQLKERRPDLVELIESNARDEVAKVKTLEQQLQEANTQLATEKSRADAAEAKIAEAQTTAKKAEAATKLAALLTEAKLPKIAEDRLKEQFKEAASIDGMEAAVKAEKDYVASLTAGRAPAKVSNLGTKDNDTQESDAGDKKVNLVESFQAMGMTEAQAKIAAAGR